MKLKIRLFARARDLAGNEYIELELAEPATVADVRSALASQHEPLAAIAPSLLIAIGTEYADSQSPVTSGTELVCFPPVSGG